MRSAAQRAEYNRQYKARPENQQKVHARDVLQRAIRSGKAVRAPSCEGCGANVRLHGHHDDYAKPLEVRWLCHPCHALKHRKSHCVHGHALVAINVKLAKFGRRQCLQCSRDRGRRASWLRTKAAKSLALASQVRRAA